MNPLSGYFVSFSPSVFDVLARLLYDSVQLVTGGLLQTAPPTSFTLEESADRILSGTNSHVEVQFITPVRNDRSMAHGKPPVQPHGSQA